MRKKRREDKYKDFADLAKNEVEGRDFLVHTQVRDSGVVVIAPHGGRIEPQTDQIVRLIAGDEFSYYIFESRSRRNLHVTSTNFNDPRCLQLIEGSEIVLAIHGCVNEKQRDSTVYCGGLDRIRIKIIKRVLGELEFSADDHPRFAGDHPKNVCNRGRTGCGIQLELPRYFRDQMASSPVLMKKFPDAIRLALKSKLVS
jgi:phage replication-related protein YjqB (UPF0714/DUF867 family)